MRTWDRWCWIVGCMAAMGVGAAAGCVGPMSLTRGLKGETLALVEQGDLRKSVSGTDAEESLSLLDESGALGQIERHGTVQWARLTLALATDRGSSLGSSQGTVVDRYRLRAGTYVVTLRGVAVGVVSGDWSVQPTLAARVRVAREGAEQPVAEQAWTIPSHLTMLPSGDRLVWVTPAKASTVALTVPSSGVYEVTTEWRLATDERSASGSLGVEGAFRTALETTAQRARANAAATAFKHRLLELWTSSLPYGGDRTEMEAAAGALATGFFTEGVDYVEAMIAPDKRRICMEHSRLTHEWFEHRSAQDPTMARWFRVTRIRREIPLFWQSSNLVTPNLDAPVERWLRDGTGLVMEPKATADDRLVGRALPVRAFSIWRQLVVMQEAEGDVTSPETVRGGGG